MTSSFSVPSKKINTIFNFSKTSKLNNWRNVNDVIMGGASRSSFELKNEDHEEFKGTVSTENNGGSASIRYRFSEKDITGKLQLQFV